MGSKRFWQTGQGLAQAILSKNCWLLWLGILLGDGTNTLSHAWIQPHIALQWQDTRSGWDSPQDAAWCSEFWQAMNVRERGGISHFYKGEPKGALQSMTYHTFQLLSGKFIPGCHKAGSGWSSSLWFKRNIVVLSRLWNEEPLYFCKDHVSLPIKSMFFVDLEKAYDHHLLYVFWGGHSQNTGWHKQYPCITGV